MTGLEWLGRAMAVLLAVLVAAVGFLAFFSFAVAKVLETHDEGKD